MKLCGMVLSLICLCLSPLSAAAEEPVFKVGFAKRDITPQGADADVGLWRPARHAFARHGRSALWPKPW